jgi:hypothetical protein
MCPDTAIYVSSAAAGHSILSSSCDATLRLWWREHVAGVGVGGEGQWRWKEVQVLTGHTASVTQFAVGLAANGACYAASVGADSQLVVWRCAGEVVGGPRGCHDLGGDARWEAAQTVKFPLKQQPVCVAMTAVPVDGGGGGGGGGRGWGGSMLLAVGIYRHTCIHICTYVGHAHSRIRIFFHSGT